MSVEVRIPEVGESIVEVQIAQWLKAEGDEVTKDEPLAVIDSEKTTFDLPAPESGRLSRILVHAGETVQVGAIIGQIDSARVAAKAPAVGAGAARPPQPKGAQVVASRSEPPGSPPTPASSNHPEPVREHPSTRIKPERTAVSQPEDRPAEAQAGEPGRSVAPIRQVAPSPDAAPVATDAGARPRARPTMPPAATREEEVVPMSMLRRTIARRLVEARQTMAMLTTFNEVDMGAVRALRQQHQEAFQERYAIKLGLMSFFVKAAIAALKEFPQLNAEVRGDDVAYHNYFDIGVAIATPQGLVAPVLRNAERLSFAEIETTIADFAQRAKERQLKPEELEGGTFTITNGGVFGSLLSTPIINPPQSGILGLHAITERPVVREGQVVIRPMMYVALTYDHRIVDGREAVLFLRRIKEVIEDPARMLIEA